jgi:hypothetical protein
MLFVLCGSQVVADVVVFNRTRALSEAPVGSKAALAASAPLRRVLCFTIQLDRELEPQLQSVRKGVTSYLNTTTKKQLRDAGLVNVAAASSQDGSMSEKSVQSVSSLSSKDGAQPTGSEPTVAAAAVEVLGRAEEALAAAVAVMTDAQPDSTKSKPDSDIEEEEKDDLSKALAVSITLSKMTEKNICLFVRCELLLAATSMQGAIERQTETTLVGISKLIREQYNGLLLY